MNSDFGKMHQITKKDHLQKPCKQNAKFDIESYYMISLRKSQNRAVVYDSFSQQVSQRRLMRAQKHKSMDMVASYLIKKYMCTMIWCSWSMNMNQHNGHQ